MNGQALYRRWRSQTFDEIIAQEHVTRTLQNALRAERIVHAYLFCGPRGTGKTSMARILAKAVNCLAEPAERPCGRCTRCRAISEGRDLDLIEIDAASNRGIDEIRDLRNKVAFAPNEGRYKVYVVDEVHMLTTEAFNALLKTLEEPPGHVIFVLATTEPQRIPATILSRCQRFDFRRIPLASLHTKIDRICQAEGIQIQPAAAEAIARRAAGSFRDAESLLDQLAAYGDAEITLERVQDLLGGVSPAAVADLVDAWIAADLAAGLRLINRLVDEGAEVRQLQLEVVEYLRALMLLQAGGDEKLANATGEMLARMRQQVAGLTLGRLVDGLRLFGQGEMAARGEVRPQLPLELAFVQAVLAATPREAGAGGGTGEEAPAASSRASAARPPRARPAVRPAVSAPQRPETATPAISPQAASPEPPEGNAEATASGEAPTLASLAARWPELLQRMRAKNKMLEAVLRSARPRELSAGRVVLEMDATFHRDRLMEERNRHTLEEVLQDLLGAPCQVECVLGDRRRPRADNSALLDDPALREDRVVRYAVRDLGAQVSGIQSADENG